VIGKTNRADPNIVMLIEAKDLARFEQQKSQILRFAQNDSPANCASVNQT